MKVYYPKCLYKTKEDNIDVQNREEEIEAKRQGYRDHWAFPDAEPVKPKAAIVEEPTKAKRGRPKKWQRPTTS